ncbi:MAG: hypothetical protein HFE62_05425 [Firmicutes bacterium]|nr:hypothetical protein [Bacillota bacterium]
MAENLFPGFNDAVKKSPLQYIQPKNSKVRENAQTMDMTSFLQLMAVQLQNQDPLNPTSNEDYMGQLAQMATIEAMSKMLESSTITYASSFMGKEVTLSYFSNGEYKTEKGVVSGVGFYNDEPIIFVNGNSYKLSNIMGVGELPEPSEPDDDKTDGDGTEEDKTEDNNVETEKP